MGYVEDPAAFKDLANLRFLTCLIICNLVSTEVIFSRQRGKTLKRKV
jgi:hypothetical protein